jgi:glycogen phosphorylase
MNQLPKQFQHLYKFDKKFRKFVAYFSMEFAIYQSLKIYSGSIGFLEGLHIICAYELKQNLIGIGSFKLFTYPSKIFLYLKF